MCNDTNTYAAWIVTCSLMMHECVAATMVNSISAETGIFRENCQYNKFADDLAPCVARSAAAMVLTG